jgi:hypothetical protein
LIFLNSLREWRIPGKWQSGDRRDWQIAVLSPSMPEHGARPRQETPSLDRALGRLVDPASTALTMEISNRSRETEEEDIVHLADRRVL